MIRVFISYTSADESFADRLATGLAAYASNSFFAKWSIKVGDSIVDRINQGLSTYDNLVVVLSRASVQSEWVRRELNASLMRQLRSKDIRILPVLVEDCNVPPLLADIKYADFRSDYNAGFASLLDVFQEDLALEPYMDLVQATPASGSSDRDPRGLAMLIKRLDPIEFGCLELLSKMHAQGSISGSDTYSESHIEARLGRVIQEGVVAKSGTADGTSFVLTELGKLVYALISAGLNEGIIGTTCSS